MEDQYNIFDLGFNKYLSKELSVLGIGQNDLSMPSIMGSSFLEIPPSQMGSGELVGNITMVAGLLQSYNFVTGSTGWQINYDGDVEFNSGVFRGSLVAGSIHIPDQNTTANSSHTDSDGNSWWGCKETDFTADNNNANAYILKTGVVKFQDATISGSVTITGGSGIGNLTDAGDLAVLDVVGDAQFSGTLTVGKTEAKCTDANADQTSVNTSADTNKVQGYTVIDGGKIKTDFLTATNIQTGILTGITIKTDTGAAGHEQRIELTSSLANFYNSDGTNCGEIYGYLSGSTPGLWISALGTDPNLMLNVPAGGTIAFAAGGAIQAYVTDSGYFHIPQDAGLDIGSGSQVCTIDMAVNDILTDDLAMFLYATNVGTGTRTCGLVFYQPKDADGYIIPYSSASANLGKSGTTWNKLWVDEIDLNGTSRTTWPSSSSYTDSDARAAIGNIIGSDGHLDAALDCDGNDITDMGDIFPTGDGAQNLGSYTHEWDNLYCRDIYRGSTLLIDLETTYIKFNKPVGFEQLSSAPGLASAWKGFMYWDTTQTDLVFSNGVTWHKVSAEPI